MRRSGELREFPSADIREEFNENGYYVARNLVGEEITAQVLQDFHLAFRQRLCRMGLPVDEGEDNASLCRNMKSLLEHDPESYLSVLRLASRLQSVYAFMMHPAILTTLGELAMATLSLSCGVAAHVVSDELRIPGGYMGWVPHQDWPVGQGSLRQIVIWAPLMDISEDFYPLDVIPGSHKSGVWTNNRRNVVTRGAVMEVDPDRIDPGDWVPLEMSRGDVVFMSGFMVHSTGAGTRSGVRIACGCRFEDITEPTYVDRGYPCAFGMTATQEELHPNFPTQAGIDHLFSGE